MTAAERLAERLRIRKALAAAPERPWHCHWCKLCHVLGGRAEVDRLRKAGLLPEDPPRD